MTRPTSLGQTSPSTAELGPFLNLAADSPQSKAGPVLSTAPPCNMATEARAGDSKFRTLEIARRGNLEMANLQKTAIVTGGSQAIGAGLVKAFLDRCYNVVANSRNISKPGLFPASADLALVDGDTGHPNTPANT